MISLHDNSGRLIVVLPVGRRRYGVFVEGEWVGEFRSGQEALAYAQSLVAKSLTDAPGTHFRSGCLDVD
jgi:hypothetical protein